MSAAKLAQTEWNGTRFPMSVSPFLKSQEASACVVDLR